MIQKFKKWLTTGTVNSKYNLFKFAIICEIILIIALTACICSNMSLKKEIKDLKEINANNELLLLEWKGTHITPLVTNDRGVVLDENYIPQTRR